MNSAGGAIRHATVKIAGVRVVSGRTSTTTDGEGRYEVRNLPPGVYSVTASKHGYVTLQHGQNQPLEPGGTTTLADGEVAEAVDITLPAAAVIVGRIVDEAGEAVAEAAVNALRSEYQNGRRTLRIVDTGTSPARTNDLGEFRIYGLPAGEYSLTAMLGGAFVSRAGEDQTLAYARTYYPNATSAEEAHSLALTPGQTLTANIELAPAKLLKVSGVAVNSIGQRMTSGSARLSRPTDTISSPRITPLHPDGSFEVEVLAVSGLYNLSVVSSSREDAGPAPLNTELGSIALTLSDRDISGIQVITNPAGIVSGNVVFEGAANIPRPQVRIFNHPADLDEMAVPQRGSIVAQADGTFELRGLFGQNLIMADLPPGGAWYMKGAYRNDQDISDSGLVVLPGQNQSGIRVVVTNTSTELQAIVNDSQGRQVVGCIVVVFSQDEGKWRHPLSRHVAYGRTDSNGHVNVHGLPAGKYFAAAMDSLASGSVADPATLKILRRDGVRVELVEGQLQSVKLGLSR